MANIISLLGKTKQRLFITGDVLAMAVLILAVSVPNASAQALAPINLTAQASPVVPPQFIPTDVTPFTSAPERNNFSPGYKFRLFQKLPERLWFNIITEASQRLDTNVLFTYSKPKADYAFRILPNITLGYEVFKNTSIYCNYFVIKDVFARDYFNITFPTTQSVSMGIRHTKQLGRKTSLQFDFQARELWQTAHLHQFDFLPNLTLSHVFNPNHVIFGSTLLQLRGGDYFVAPTREIDPFYTVGYLYRHGKWAFIAEDTLVTNFRHPPFNDAIPNQSNVTMIADFEINHPVTKKINGLVAFLRAEPIWNWDSNKFPGLSGFDFRLYSGLRLAINKPSYYSTIESILNESGRNKRSSKKKTKSFSKSKNNSTNKTGNAPADSSSTNERVMPPASQVDNKETSDSGSVILH